MFDLVATPLLTSRALSDFRPKMAVSPDYQHAYQFVRSDPEDDGRDPGIEKPRHSQRRMTGLFRTAEPTQSFSGHRWFPTSQCNIQYLRNNPSHTTYRQIAYLTSTERCPDKRRPAASERHKPRSGPSQPTRTGKSYGANHNPEHPVRLPRYQAPALDYIGNCRFNAPKRCSRPYCDYFPAVTDRSSACT